MELVNEQYSIQGITLTDLCNEYGSPLFVYDGAKILSQYNRLVKAFGSTPVRIKYAAKALTNQSILKLLKEAGCGIDVVSVEELQLALKVGFAPKSIMFTPNCSDYSEIQSAVKAGVTVNIDNLPFLELFGKEFGSSYPICIRINPHIVAGGNEKIQTGHKESKFGISKDQEADVHSIVGKYGIVVRGIHVHSGSDFKDSDAFVKAAEVIFGIARHFKELKFLDFGSGFKVAYKEGDVVTDVEDLGRKMTEAFNAFCASYGRDLELWFEPGKFLVSESGYLLVTTTVVKETPACTFVGVNSGLNHLIRPMMYGSYHGFVNLSNPKGEKKHYNVVGYICETDTFGSNLALNEVRRGDILAVKNAGAYCFSMSSNYNSRLRPAEILIHKGKAFLIRKRETMEDLLRLQVETSW
jgi:diaminopimelate decarboxylase